MLRVHVFWAGIHLARNIDISTACLLVDGFVPHTNVD